MKRVFISLPMKNRLDEAIEKSIKLMEETVSRLLGTEELEFTNNHTVYDIPKHVKNENIFCLGKSIQKIASCNYIATLGGWGYSDYPECDIENDIATKFNVKNLYLGDVYLYCSDLSKYKYDEEQNIFDPDFDINNIFNISDSYLNENLFSESEDSN